MFVLLPAEGMTTSDVLPYLSEDAVNTALEGMKPAQIRLSLPKFKQDFGMILNSTLKKMGIEKAFTQAADFKGIAEMGSLVLDQVKQKCYIDVTEKGTEAAAVTVAQMKLTSVRPQPFVTMTVDRPFIFFIADMDKSNVLFAGNIVNL
jgi:serpin B